MAGRLGLPSMAGRVVADEADACFVPGFPFVDGTGYRVEAGGHTVAELVRPRRGASPTTSVIAIRPSVAEVPRNLLRFYLWFSSPMSEGVAGKIQALKKMAHGFRNRDHFKIAIYFHCGDLDLYPH